MAASSPAALSSDVLERGDPISSGGRPATGRPEAQGTPRPSQFTSRAMNRT
jgi:hypothetical protein